MFDNDDTDIISGSTDGSQDGEHGGTSYAVI